MSDSIFKGVEIVGTSGQSFSHAIEVAVTRARKTLHNLSWFVVEEMRGGLQQDRLQYQVTLRVFFKLDDVDEPSDAGETSVGGQIATKKGGSAKKGRGK
jgi:flavin-binding protein dodecin